MIRVGIAGAAGYTAGELIRVLISHPQVELRYLQSESHRGEPVGRVHRDLIYTNLKFSDLDLTGIDVLFLCMGHGMSAQFLERHPVPASVRIIDLSHDFRLKSNAGDFIYGLPELNRERIQGAWHVANPGCFATAIELGLLPLAKSGLCPAPVAPVIPKTDTWAGSKPLFANGRRIFRFTRLSNPNPLFLPIRTSGSYSARPVRMPPLTGYQSRKSLTRYDPAVQYGQNNNSCSPPVSNKQVRHSSP